MIDITFEQSPLQSYLDSLAPGQLPTAANLLALCDSEEDLEQVFEQETAVDLSDLPAFSNFSETAQRLSVEAQLHSVEELTQFGADDPLGMYMEELAQIPVCGDEQVLALELLEGNQTAGEKLMNLSLRRVVEISFEYTGKGVLLLDLIQEGSMGLWVGLAAYAGGDYTQFRDTCIRRAMEKAVLLQAYAAGLGQKLRQAVEDYRMTDQRLLGELGRIPTMEEIAEALHMSAEEAAMVAGVLESANSMNRAKPQEEEPQEEEQAVEDTAYFQMRQRIGELLSELSPKEAELLTLRYGLEGGKPLSAGEAGLKLGLTPQQAVELEAAALQKLRKQ